MNRARDHFLRGLDRNGPCPCGSGNPYSKCHMSSDSGSRNERVNSPMPASAVHQMQLAEAKERLRQMQQGKGKPILSAEVRGHRFITIGSEVIHSKKFKTFHDFLFSYLPMKLGGDWGDQELQKPLAERHPVLQWHHKLCEFERQHHPGDGEIATVPMTGAISAFLRLSYSLYLLQHNVVLQERFLQRLRHQDQFYPAFYETLVAGAFINAGFEIELEREDDSTRSHCEFTATSKKTGKRYSVEAKSRQPGKSNNNVRNQLHAALTKKADHERIVFIELNVPAHSDTDISRRMEDAIQSVINAQDTMTVDRQTAPPAYVMVTNHSWIHELDGVNGRRSLAVHGFKIHGFEFSPPAKTVGAIVREREDHRDIFDLITSLLNDRGVPSTFDGDMPELAFAKERVIPLIIGERYDEDDFEGSADPFTGVLEEATVNPSEQAAICIVRTDDGKRIIVKAPLTADEMLAYERFPDVFFGKHKPQRSFTSEQPAEIFEWLLSTYAQTPREGLLHLMAHWPNQEQLAALPQPELARKYCISLTEAMLRRSQLATTREQKPPGVTSGRSVNSGDAPPALS